jgi:epoxyqueuosine reductase
MSCARLVSPNLRGSTTQHFAQFTKSPVKRIGRDRFLRNVLIAIGNSGDAVLADEARRLLDDASPLVRGAAVWALGQLLPDEEFTVIKTNAIAAERDEGVREEWELAS